MTAPMLAADDASLGVENAAMEASVPSPPRLPSRIEEKVAVEASAPVPTTIPELPALMTWLFESVAAGPPAESV